MKKLILFIIGFLIGFYCFGQNKVFAMNDTLYFDDIEYYVPKYPDSVTIYCDYAGKQVNIKTCPEGVYLKELFINDFRIVQLYYKKDD